jgi:hypothetical protein
MTTTLPHSCLSPDTASIPDDHAAAVTGDAQPENGLRTFIATMDAERRVVTENYVRTY